MTELLSEDEFFNVPRHPERLKEWRWSIADSVHRDTWWEIHLDETDEFPDARRHPFPYVLAIDGPAGLHLRLGRFPSATLSEYIFDDRTHTHCWTVPTSYGNWEVAYTEGEQHGFLALHVCPDEDDTPEMPVSLIAIPTALVAELGACLTLPPAAWHLREGWMDHLELHVMRLSHKGLEPPI